MGRRPYPPGVRERLLLASERDARGGDERVQRDLRPVASVGQKVPVRRVNLGDRRAHEARQLEEGDAARDSERRVGMTKRVRRAMLQPGCSYRGRPVMTAKAIEVNPVARANAREEQLGVNPDRLLAKRLGRASRERDDS